MLCSSWHCSLVIASSFRGSLLTLSEVHDCSEPAHTTSSDCLDSHQDYQRGRPARAEAAADDLSEARGSVVAIRRLHPHREPDDITSDTTYRAHLNRPADEQPAHARDVHSHSGLRYSGVPQALDTQ